jgi:hypothetical protein
MSTQSTERTGRKSGNADRPDGGRRGPLGSSIAWFRALLAGPDRAKGVRLLVVPAVGLVVLAGIGLWQPTLLNSVRTSWKAAAFAVVCGGVIALGGLVVARLRGPEWLSHTVTGVVAVAAVALTVTPTLTADTVNDELVEAPPPAASGAQPSAGGPSAGAAQPGPKELGKAALRGIDHDATGQARIVTLADGSTVVRLESLDVEPGPDYFVYLAPGEDVTEPEGARLGKLKAPRGNQNYEVPAGTAVQAPVTVLIWCRAFSVPIANATIG